jgi:alkanesulfonate monooxygenase SsuD/methylene tetrahydromethanopterin reductase-like flavin-dependent oxidoreductase (luciferase family)
MREPYAMAACNVVVADTDEEARFAFSSAQLGVLNMLRGRRGKMQPPIDNIEQLWSPAEKDGVERFLRCSFVGSGSTVKVRLQEFLKETGADELIVTARIFDPKARFRSLELLAGIRDEICEKATEFVGSR